MTNALTKERLAAFSDAVFAVIITIMVLQLKMPQKANLDDLLQTWPSVASYLASYLLIVIMWINHHYLLSFGEEVSPRHLVWTFVHMFAASLVPFGTAWVAGTRMASLPVFMYAAIILFVNVSYHGFAQAVIPRDTCASNRRRALIRSTVTLGIFIAAMALSFKFPGAAFAVVTLVVLSYAYPELKTTRYKSDRRAKESAMQMDAMEPRNVPSLSPRPRVQTSEFRTAHR